MSSSGYDNGVSESEGSSAGCTPYPRNVNGSPIIFVQEQNVAAPTYGVNNFVNGMHSFRSAAEAQFYLDRIAGQGSRAVILSAVHAPLMFSNENRAGQVLSGSAGLVPITNSDFLNPVTSGNQLSTSFALGASSLQNNIHGMGHVLNRGLPLPGHGSPNGNDVVGRQEGSGAGRRSIILFCELHSAVPTSEASISNATENDHVDGHCAICRHPF